MKALAMTTYQCHIAGVPVRLGFEAVRENIPLLMALPHLDGLGALLDLPRRVAHFPKGRGELCEGEERGPAQHRYIGCAKVEEEPRESELVPTEPRVP